MKKWISYGVLFLCIPLTLGLGNTVFHNKRYAFITLTVSLLSCVPFFLSFDRKKHSGTRLILIAVMTALSVCGRFLFYALPGFKPVTAITIITALYLGGEAGFMTGALTAVISNMAFGQGPWTPFQMFTWGLIGFVAGVLAKQFRKSRVLLCVYGALSGVLFSLVMDVYAVLWQDNFFNFTRYTAVLISSVPFMMIYAVSNGIFLFILEKPIGLKLQRIKDKYGV